jgi:hypothetical protein
MSEPQDETSLTENPGAEPVQDPPAATPPRDEGLVDELEGQERGGWLDEPTTG